MDSKSFKIKKILIIGMMISLNIVFVRFLAIETAFMRLSLGFVPIIFIAMLYGSFEASATAAISDVLGMLIAPKGIYFPGFTLTAAVGGFLYGYFLKDYVDKNKITLAFYIVLVSLAEWILNSCWISYILSGNFSKFSTIFISLIHLKIISGLIIFWVTDKIIFRIVKIYQIQTQKLPIT